MSTQLWRVLAVVLALLTSAVERGGSESSSCGLRSWSVEGPLPQIGDAQPGASRPALLAAVPGLQKLRGGGACIPVLNPEHDPAAGDDLGVQLLRAASLGNTRLVTPPNHIHKTKPLNPPALSRCSRPERLHRVSPLFPLSSGISWLWRAGAKAAGAGSGCELQE